MLILFYRYDQYMSNCKRGYFYGQTKGQGV